jgi:integrase
MALFKRGKVWWMRLTYQGRQIRRSTEVKDKKLAQRIYDKVVGQIAEGKWFERVPGEDKTVNELLDRYLRDHSKPNKAPSTYCRDLSLSANLRDTFGSYTLVQVRPSLITEYKARRRAKGASPKSINNELTLLSHAFTLAMREWEWVLNNPVQRVSRERVHNQIERWLTFDEEQRLLAVSPEWLREIIVFAIHTGLRQGEILNLQWPLVDLFRRTITLVEQKNRCKDTLPLNGTALEVLKARARVRSRRRTMFFSTERRTEWIRGISCAPSTQR